MPINYRDYHPKWTLIRRLVLRRAGNRCELCGLPNGALGRAGRRGTWRPATEHEADIVAGARAWQLPDRYVLRELGLTRIILSVAHLDRDRGHNRFHNLAALCRACHINYDRPAHLRTRRYGIEHRYRALLLPFATTPLPPQRPLLLRRGRRAILLPVKR